MYTISSNFQDFLLNYDREFLIKANVANVDYLNDEIVSFKTENSLTLSDEFEIGTAILSKLTLQLRTQDIIPQNAKVIPYVALTRSGVTTEWLPLGEFYIDSREQNADVWTFTCYDKLVLADVPYVSALTYPTTMQAVWNEICTSLSYVSDASVVINGSYQVQVAPTGYTKRQVMGYIAGANAASLYVGKDGKIKFKKFSNNDTPVFEMRTSDYITVRITNPVKTFNKFVVVYNTDDDLAYTSGSGTEAQTLYYENPLMNQTMVNALNTAMGGFTYLPIAMTARGFPQLDVGDVLAFDKNDSKPWIETYTTWSGTTLPWDGTKEYQSIILHTVLEFRGGLKMTIEAPSKSDQQSEFAVDGTLSGQINKLNKTAVREDRKYYGATLTRQNGLIIERNDLASKVVLNSDEFSFKVGNTNKLYFDPVAGKYKFVGDIVMEGGSISWSGVTAPAYSDITGTKPPTNADNTTSAIGSNRLTYIDSSGVYTGTVQANQVIASTISAISANLGTVTAGSITANTTINVGTDITIGETLSFSAGSNRGIIFETSGGSLAAYITYSSGSISLGASNGLGVLGGLRVNGANVATQSWVSANYATSSHTHSISDVSGLQSALDGKASTSHTHTVAGGAHNHGIADGTVLLTTGGGSVTWVAYGGFSITV